MKEGFSIRSVFNAIKRWIKKVINPGIHIYHYGKVHKFLFKLLRFIFLLPIRIWHFIRGIWRGIVRICKGCVNAVKNLWFYFANGDTFVKLSFLVMGCGLLVRKQIVKGLLYLVTQVGFILFFVLFGWQYLRDIGTLGNAAQEVIGYTASGLPLYSKPDNSMLILLYSIMFLLLSIAFLALWYSNLKAAYAAQRAHEEGKSLPNMKQTLALLLNEKYHITLLTVPTLLVVIFTILPIIFMILIAFTNFDKNHQPPGNLFTWVGFNNFKDIFGGNPLKTQTFTALLKWTFTWAFFATFTNYIFGMILALMINKKGIRMKKMWRTIFVMTIAVPQFVSLLLVSKLFGDQGTVNLIIEKLGGSPIQFLTNGFNAKVMVIVINMWVGIPYTMLQTSGILMNIPKDLYESARVDGAGVLKTFFKITLPYILFVTTPYLITTFVGNFNNFNVIFLLTRGDPKSLNLYQAGETDLLVTWLYKLTVDWQDYSLASVIGILVFIVSATLSLIVYNSSTSMKNEEAFG